MKLFTKKLIIFSINFALGTLIMIVSFKGKELPLYPLKGMEPVSLCSTKLKDNTKNLPRIDVLPTIYFITPTYPRGEQIAELTRLSQTLMHVPNLHWVIGEDSASCSKMINSLLERSGILYTHLISPMPDLYKELDMKDRPRGVSGRRAGIYWVLNHTQNILKEPSYINTPKAKSKLKITSTHQPTSVIYFGDDDNT